MGNIEEFRTNNRCDLHILFLQRNSGLASENQQLTQSFTSAEVNTGIRLGQAIFLCFPYYIGKTAGDIVVGGEDAVKCAADYRLDREELIAGVSAGGDAFQHGQGGSDGCLIAEEHPVFLGGGVHGGVLHERHCQRPAVGTHYVDAFAEKALVLTPDVLAVGRIHEDAAAGGLLTHGAEECAVGGGEIAGRAGNDKGLAV